jgi:hypothetical protein
LKSGVAVIDESAGDKPPPCQQLSQYGIEPAGEAQDMERQISTKIGWIGWLVLPALLAAGGCGGSARVTGKVTYQGRPVTYGSVIFLSTDKTARSGVILPDGSYTIEGVPPGEAKIGVISRDPSKGRSTVRTGKPARPSRKRVAPQRAAKDASPGWFRLPAKLEDPETSGIRCTIDARSVNHDIELK